MNCFMFRVCFVFIYVRIRFLCFGVFPLCCCLVVSTSAIDCLERLVSEMTYYLCVECNVKPYTFTYNDYDHDHDDYYSLVRRVAVEYMKQNSQSIKQCIKSLRDARKGITN